MTVGVSTSVNVRQDIYLSLPYCNRLGLTGVPTFASRIYRIHMGASRAVPLFHGISFTADITSVGILVALPNST